MSRSVCLASTWCSVMAVRVGTDATRCRNCPQAKRTECYCETMHIFRCLLRQKRKVTFPELGTVQNNSNKYWRLTICPWTGRYRFNESFKIVKLSISSLIVDNITRCKHLQHLECTDCSLNMMLSTFSIWKSLIMLLKRRISTSKFQQRESDV